MMFFILTNEIVTYLKPYFTASASLCQFNVSLCAAWQLGMRYLVFSCTADIYGATVDLSINTLIKYQVDFLVRTNITCNTKLLHLATSVRSSRKERRKNSGTKFFWSAIHGDSAIFCSNVDTRLGKSRPATKVVKELAATAINGNWR
jgi:hypothetical protein